MASRAKARYDSGKSRSRTTCSTIVIEATLYTIRGTPLAESRVADGDGRVKRGTVRAARQVKGNIEDTKPRRRILSHLLRVFASSWPSSELSLDQKRKYRCASGSTSAGSHASSSPSARTS